jgi:hypothetical protein
MFEVKNNLQKFVTDGVKQNHNKALNNKSLQGIYLMIKSYRKNINRKCLDMFRNFSPPLSLVKTQKILG